MGKRSWLNELLEQKLLPTLAKLPDTDEGKAKAQELNHWLRLRWTERGYKHLNQQQSLMDQTRAAIKSKLGDTHFALESINFTTEEYTLINDAKQQSVALRNEDVKQIDNPDAIVAVAVSLLDSSEWAEIAAGLAVLTGRRSSELLATAQFQPLTEWSVTFTGALKRRGETQTLSFEIPTLTNSLLVCNALAKIRHQLPDAQHLSAAEVNSRYGQAVVSACDRHFESLVPPRDGGNLYTHLFRAIYATIATFWFCPPKVDPVEFRAAIQGHYAVLDQKNPELRRSLAASRHYSDFEIADRVIAQANGQRKGIKLGINGVEPIQAFKNTLIPAPPTPPRKHPSTLRIWSEDRHDLTAVLAHFPGHLQADKITAWIAWSQQMFRQQSDAQATTDAVSLDNTTADPTSQETAQALQSVVEEGRSNSASLPVSNLPQKMGLGAEAKKKGQASSLDVSGSSLSVDVIKPAPFSGGNIPEVPSSDVEVPSPEEGAINPPHFSGSLPVNDSIQSNSGSLSVKDSIQSNPAMTPEPPISSGLEAKLDGLITVMTQFIQLQMLKEQQPTVSNLPGGKHQLSRTPESLPQQASPATPVLAPTTSQSTAKTGQDDPVIHAAIDAIIAHNNRQQLHDLKWEITINTLKAFSRNQRAIERILGKGRDNPHVSRIVGTREDEIASHHQHHHILPGHNHRHKRRRKITDVLSDADLSN